MRHCTCFILIFWILIPIGIIAKSYSAQPSFVVIPSHKNLSSIGDIKEKNPDLLFTIEQLTQALEYIEVNVVDVSTILDNLGKDSDYLGADILIEVDIKRIPKFGKTVVQVSMKYSLAADKTIRLALGICESPPFDASIETSELIIRALKDYNYECLRTTTQTALEKFKEKIGDRQVVELFVKVEDQSNWNLYTDIKTTDQSIGYDQPLWTVIDSWVADQHYSFLSGNTVVTESELRRKILIPNHQSIKEISDILKRFLETLESSDWIPVPNLIFKVYDDQIIIELY